MYPKKEIVIRTQDLEARYGNRIILKEINLKVYRGEILAILGSSGCGKTTLLKHLIGLLKPYRGEVEIFGKSLNN
ncbi:MAG: ATP-binding cassette domain-containing protein [bacterium]